MRTKASFAAIAASTFLAALLLIGCSSGGGTGTTTPDGPSSSSGTIQPTPDAQAYAECMRDNGVEMADPDPSTGLPQFGDGVDPSSPAVQKAMDACHDLMPAGAREQAGNEDMDAYLAYSKCMRENGLPDFPDPQPGSDKGVFGDTGIDRNNPTYQKAAQACQHVLEGEHQ